MPTTIHEDMIAGSKGTHRGDDKKMSFEEKTPRSKKSFPSLKNSSQIRNSYVTEALPSIIFSRKTHSFIIKTSSFPIMIFIQIMHWIVQKSSQTFTIKRDMKMSKQNQASIMVHTKFS
jgi:hypothetical protein